MTIGAAPVCMKCKHYDREGKYNMGLNCDAFPEGIPDDIIFGNHIHRTLTPVIAVSGSNRKTKKNKTQPVLTLA